MNLRGFREESLAKNAEHEIRRIAPAMGLLARPPTTLAIPPCRPLRRNSSGVLSPVGLCGEVAICAITGVAAATGRSRRLTSPGPRQLLRGTRLRLACAQRGWQPALALLPAMVSWCCYPSAGNGLAAWPGLLGSFGTWLVAECRLGVSAWGGLTSSFSIVALAIGAWRSREPRPLLVGVSGCGRSSGGQVLAGCVLYSTQA